MGNGLVNDDFVFDAAVVVRFGVVVVVVDICGVEDDKGFLFKNRFPRVPPRGDINEFCCCKQSVKFSTDTVCFFSVVRFFVSSVQS